MHMKIRKATAIDAKGIAKVQVDTWRSTYKNIVSDEYLAQLSYDAREEMWQKIIPINSVYVAENDQGEIIGFSCGGKKNSEEYPKYKSELFAIYILQDYQREGIGRLLVKPIVEDLIDEEIYSMIVYVFEDNPATKFYESLGGKKIDHLDTEFSTEEKKVYELVYGWDDIRQIF